MKLKISLILIVIMVLSSGCYSQMVTSVDDNEVDNVENNPKVDSEDLAIKQGVDENHSIDTQEAKENSEDEKEKLILDNDENTESIIDTEDENKEDEDGNLSAETEENPESIENEEAVIETVEAATETDPTTETDLTTETDPTTESEEKQETVEEDKETTQALTERETGVEGESKAELEAKDDSDSDNTTEAIITVSITIIGVNESIIFETISGEYEDVSAFDVLEIICNDYNIALDYSGSNANVYIKGINQLYEFDYGNTSGWMYHVNGEFPPKSSGAYELKDKDNLVFCYSKDGGLDVGARSLN